MIGTIHSKFLLQSQMINKQALKLYQDKSWLLDYENIPAHNALNIQQLSIFNFPIHLDFLRVTFYFGKFKEIIKRICFKGVEIIKMTITTELRSVSEKSF